MEEHIYNEDEYQKALAWIKKYCRPGFDKNPDFVKKSDEQKEKDWEFTAKMACIIEDLYQGNPNLPEGCGEEAVGHNAIAGGFQGQRQWTDHWPNCDFPEAILNTSFDWNGAREPFILATENDTLNSASMLFMKLLTNRPQMFADVRTYWSTSAVKRVTDYDIEGHAKDADGFIHLINSGACCLDACGEVKDENGTRIESVPQAYKIRNRALLQEMVSYAPEKNTDRVSALFQVMFYREQFNILYGGAGADTELEKDASDDEFFDRDWKAYTTKHFGEDYKSTLNL